MAPPRWLPLAFLLLAFVTLVVADSYEDNEEEPKSDAAYNDDKYPSCGKESCTDKSAVRCKCENAAVGRYRLPNYGRCVGITGNNDNPRCAQASISRAGCCQTCKTNSKCKYWQHFVPITKNPTCSDCGICYIYTNNKGPKCATKSWKGRLYANASTVGSRTCPHVENDPHFMGARGTEFEFNGLPDQSFCLLTERKFQVNMKMRGYYDERTVKATVLKNGKAIRSWIKELGFVWVDKRGQTHLFHMVARNGKSQTRDAGFVSLMELDNEVLKLEVGETYSLNGFQITFVGYEKTGGGFFDVDVYRVKILNYLEMEIKSRIAHPLLQTPDDAQAHLNVAFEEVQKSDAIHGVMGQTYRAGREQRAVDYAALNSLLGTPIAADGENGKGFLDGEVADYEVPSVLETRCKYSAFGGASLPAIDDKSGHKKFIKAVTA